MSNLGWLVGSAVLAALLGWFGGRMAAQSVDPSDEAVAKLAPRVFADSAFSTALDSSTILAEQAELTLADALENGQLIQELMDNPNSLEVIDGSVARSLYEGAGMQVLNEIVEEKTAALVRTPSTAAPTSAGPNANQIAELQQTMRRYDRRLKQLANQVQDDESAAAVNVMQGQLFEMQGLLSGLSKDVRCMVASGSGTRSFLLKERRSTPLSGVDLLVTLGRLRKGVLNTVSISGRNPNAGAGEAQGVTAVKANVRIGKPFQFAANGRVYEGTFTYSQGRWGPDFVGFEMREMPADEAALADC